MLRAYDVGLMTKVLALGPYGWGLGFQVCGSCPLSRRAPAQACEKHLNIL